MMNKNLFKKINPFHKIQFSLFSTHTNRVYTGPKAYRRIWPAAQFLMKSNNIKEDQFDPSIQIIMKEHVLDLIENMAMQKDMTIHHIKVEHQPDKKDTSHITAPLNKMKQNMLNTITESPLKENIMKEKIPQFYFSTNTNIDNLLTYLNNLNKSTNLDLKIEDFIAKVAAKIIEINPKLNVIYDINSNKVNQLENSFSFDIYLKTLKNNKTHFTEEQFVYLKINNNNLANLNEFKKNMKEMKENYSPVLRLFNYIEINSKVDEMITPPATLTLTLGPLNQNLSLAEDNKLKIVKTLNLSLTAMAGVHEEETCIEFLSKLADFVSNPLSFGL